MIKKELRKQWQTNNGYKETNMERVSSQGTIFIRIAIPTIWLTTIFSLIVLLLLAVQGKAQIFSNPVMWLVFIIMLGSGIAFIYFVLWRIYRVDMDDEAVYVSNYFKTYRYPFSAITGIRESKFFPGRVFIIELRSKGTFGKEIAFLASQKLWKDYLLEHPDVVSMLRNKHRGTN